MATFFIKWTLKLSLFVAKAAFIYVHLYINSLILSQLGRYRYARWNFYILIRLQQYANILEWRYSYFISLANSNTEICMRMWGIYCNKNIIAILSTALETQLENFLHTPTSRVIYYICS